MTGARKISHCRLCRGRLSRVVLSLGDQPISNRLPKIGEESEVAAYPLDVVLCEDCGLAQLAHDLDADEHFHDDYAYISGASSTWVDHCRDYARGLIARHGVSERDYVVEAGSNDGTLLKAFRDAGVQGIGVEPSANVAKLAEDAGIATLNAFFDAESSAALKAGHGPPKAVIGNNVLAHTPFTHEFLIAGRDLIAADGFLCFEFPHVLNILEKRYFDTIYHEHYAYLGVRPLMHWAAANGMEVYAVEPQTTHGGSLRVFLRHATGAPTPDDVLAIAEKERVLSTPRAWAELDTWLQDWRLRFSLMIARLQGDGRSIAGYAAASKATVICNYLGLTGRDVAYCCDASPFKQGRLIPGANIPILEPEAMRRDPPDVVIAFAWNIFEEIARVVGELTGGRAALVRPLPDIELVAADERAGA
jgi:hypothetical protein